MNESEKIIFYDISKLTETKNVRRRCKKNYIEKKLKTMLPVYNFKVISAKVFDDGKYTVSLLKKICDLPSFCEVQIEVKTGKKFEEIIVWSPLSWNDRFIGTGGGGTGTGGSNFINQPDNACRGMTLPFAIMNGFSAASGNAMNYKERSIKDLTIDEKTGKPDPDILENWRLRTTHDMTVFGKAVTEIIHDRKPIYSYFHGGSGGGRQAMVEAQNYPEDYNGIWASCPAINWTKFLPMGFWFSAVMNEYNYVISYKKMEIFRNEIIKKQGGENKFYKNIPSKVFDPYALVGKKRITKKDADVFSAFLKGPYDENGNRLWYSFRPGVKFYNNIIPIGAYYYSFITKKPKAFLLCSFVARWTGVNPKTELRSLNISTFNKFFKETQEILQGCGADNPDLRKFAALGNKLILDHGYNDPLIPIDGSINYYDRVTEIFGSKENVKSFFRMYLNPGDGHGDCYNKGAGITESDGFTALMDWVEKGTPPEKIRVARIDKKSKKILYETFRKEY